MSIDAHIKAITTDERITVWDSAVYIAMLSVWTENLLRSPITISRRIIMKKAHIGSIVTYHKCVKVLVALNYIEYHPSYHPLEATKVFVRQII